MGRSLNELEVMKNDIETNIESIVVDVDEVIF